MSTVLFPIRLKIMVALLFALTMVVIAISFTMGAFFHEDKRSYMNDWVSIAAVSTADEARSLLQGYSRQLEICSSIMLDTDIPGADRQRLVREIFDRFPELVEISLHRGGDEVDSARDVKALEAAGLTVEQLRDFRRTHPLPSSSVLAVTPYVENSTIAKSLPSLTIAFARKQSGTTTPLVVSGLVRLDELLRLGARFRVFEVGLESSDGTLLAHPDLGRVVRREKAYRPVELEAAVGRNRAAQTVQYRRDNADMIGGFAPVQFAGITAAAQMPKAAAFLASRDLIHRLISVAVILLATVAVGGRLWSRRITRPLERLSEATRVIAKGSFDVKVDVQSRDEIGALAGSFNQMASELEVRETALKEAHSQLIQSEKMAAFGQLGAGIAHEVKNPLAGILGCAQISLLDVEQGTFLHKNLTLIEKETNRCKTIVENLLRFARQEKAVKEPIRVNQVVDDAAAIVNHQLEIHKVKIAKELAADLPLVNGNANQLQQVLMNLLVNAQQAMGGKEGRIRIATRAAEGGKIEISVTDDGPGIPREIQHKLFDPFFTTKPAGQGTGLGLSVSFGIIKDHDGEIVIRSEPGQGATFLITLPALPAVAPARIAGVAVTVA